ncbi:MAG: serine hydrolase, partial [Bacteroidota bacterium]
VTDAMDMQGVTNAYSIADAAVRAVKAGADLVLLPPDAGAAIDAIVSAVRRNEIDESRIDRSVRTVLAAKEAVGLAGNRFVALEPIPGVVGSASHVRLAREVARAGITVVRNEGSVLPLGNNLNDTLVSITFGDLEDPSTGSLFRSSLSRRVSNVLDLRIDGRSNALEFDSALVRARAGDLILVHMYLRTRSGAMTGFLPEPHAEFLQDLLALDKPTVVISFGNPYLVEMFPEVHAYVSAYSDADAVVEAAVEILFGETPSRGKLPISIPGGFRRGTGIELPQVALRHDDPAAAGFDPVRLSELDRVMGQAIRDGAFPGGVVLVAKDGIVAHHKAYGKMSFDPLAREVQESAIYDIASLTKVVATTGALMRLVDEDRVKLDDRVGTYIPAFAAQGKELVTVRNLMVHDSGLPPWKRFYEMCETPRCVLDSVFASELIYTTGDSTVYSDLGFITMGKVVEAVTGAPLHVYVDSVFFRPLGMANTMFNPSPVLRPRIPPTEVDLHWKQTGQAVRGRVHDENAAVLGGVSGHAGLFSTASDLAVFVQMLVNGGSYGGRRYLNEQTVRRFTARQSEKSTRAIGWDTKSPEGRSSAGRLFGKHSFGHTGFTGTSIWVDPERKLFVILLTNRVHPTRENSQIFSVRPLVHDTVIKALVDP